MINIDKEQIIFVQKYLDKYMPSPELEIVELCDLFFELKNNDEKSIKLQRLLLDFDDLIQQLRWYIGYAKLLTILYPQIYDADGNDSPRLRGKTIPAKIQLMLRTDVAFADKVMYHEPNDILWRGGIFVGWIHHSFMDSAIFRLIAAFDRLAHILWIIAGLKKDRVYFRSRKISKIHDKLKMFETERLVEIAEDEFLDIILDYRDSLMHENTTYSRAACYPPDDFYVNDQGEKVQIANTIWDVEELYEIVDETYGLLLEAVPLVVAVCRNILGF